MNRKEIKIAPFHLGTNPLIGHSYVSQVKVSLSDAEKEAVIEKCTEMGIQGAVLQTTPELVQLFSHHEFDIVGVVGSDLRPTRDFMKSVTAEKISVLIQPEIDLLRRLFDVKICLHGIITDALLRAERGDILEGLIERIGNPTGAATHFPGDTLESLEDVGASFCLCGFNPSGFMMKPSLDATLCALRKTRIPVIAKKVLAGGWLPPAKAVDFFQEYGSLVDSCVVGVKSPEEVEETFGALKTVFPQPT